MLLKHEQNSNIYHIIYRGAFCPGYVDTGEKPARATGTACPDYSHGSRRNAESGNCPADADFASYGSTVAAAVFSSSLAGVGKRRSAIWSHAEDFGR